MNHKKIGFLHPGAMGISLAATAQNSGYEAYWVEAGRSEATKARALEHNLIATGSLAEMAVICSTIVSVCPPHAAQALAHQVLETSFKGLYADVNAISPQKSIGIGKLMQKAGIQYVDGGIVGGPAWEKESTWLYLSGEHAPKIVPCFARGPLELELMGPEIGSASALKMSFAGYTKGTTALLCAIVASAEKLGVRAELEKQWSRNGSPFAEQTRNRISRVTAKAWRFSGEMEEIADTLEASGLPPGFHQAAGAIYERLSGYKNRGTFPEVEEVLQALLGTPDE